MIPAVFLFILGVIAFSEACHHFKDIERHRPINHGYALAFRIAIGSVMFAVMSVTHWLLAEDYRFLLLAPMGWAWWTAWFRFLLNNMRGKDWRYVSPSNWYDRLFLGYGFRRMSFWDLVAAKSSYRGLYGNAPEVTRHVHRAGTLAYVFEALVFAASIAAYFLLR